MVSVKVANIQSDEHMGSITTTILLVDEQQQRAMPLSVQRNSEQLEGISIHASLEKDIAESALARPRTLDLLIKLLKASGGELEGICIDTLQGEMLYAQVYLRDQYNQHTLKASLNEALPLALQLKSPISVSDAISASKWIDLTEHGETLQLQLEAVMHAMRTNPMILYLKKEPYNTDFTQGLQGWQFMGPPEYTDYYLDTLVTCTGPASLAIDLRELPASAMAPVYALVRHEGFLAQHYQGQRLRMLTHIKTEHLQLVRMHLQVAGPPAEKVNEATGMHPSTYSHETYTMFHPITDTCDWTRQELVIDVPTDAFIIYCYFAIEGAGRLWIDAVRFEPVNMSIPLTPLAHWSGEEQE